MSSDANTEIFDPVDVPAIAANHDVEAERLQSLCSDHQEQMAALPGVENLVYEWRSQFGVAVHHRSERVYVVDAPEWAWEEFADPLAASDAEMAALRSLHRQAVVAHDTAETPIDSDVSPMVLQRP